MKKKRLILILTALLIGTSSMLAEAMTDSLVSNYGNWMNLTNGYSDWHSGYPQKMEVAIDGNTIHLYWMDGNVSSDNTVKVWYRRSTDLGKTWENAHVLLTTHWRSLLNANNKLMSVSNGRVHFAVLDEEESLASVVYLRSNDGGANFSHPQTIKKMEDWYHSLSNVQIASDGDMVVIAASHNRDNNVTYFVSKDYGKSFTDHTEKYEPGADPSNGILYDLQVSGGKWASMYNIQGVGYSRYEHGELFITTSDGSNITKTQVAPLQSDGMPHAELNYFYGYNNYHPQMAIVGNTIHLMYRGAQPNSSEIGDRKHMLYQKSTDFGKTWANAYSLPASEDGQGMIAAKGQNVYILTSETGFRRAIYYSHDGGDTWNIQDQCNWPNNSGVNNPNNYYSLSIAPDDPSGNHVYFTSSRYFYEETKDGFKSIKRNSVLGSEVYYGGDNYCLMVMGDQNGQEHWFMQLSKPGLIKDGAGNDVVKSDFSRDICYRRPQAEPAPSREAALDMTLGKLLDKRVVIPMSPSMSLTDAITVEAWVYAEDRAAFQIAASTDDESQIGSKYKNGWYMVFEASGASDGLTVRAGKNNAEVIGTNGGYIKMELNKWHHVAITYDAHLTENNFCLYLDGMLAGRVTSGGPVMSNINPICLGHNTLNYGSKAMIDDFSIWSRALTQEEIRNHIYNTPDGKDKDCRVMLTFNNTLRDESQYHNDALAQLDVKFVEHEAINPPHPDFVMAKDQTGKTVTLSDATVDGKAVYWVWGSGFFDHSFDHSVKLENLQPGNHVITMVAAGDNACVTVTKLLSISGLSRVEPSVAGQYKGVRLKIVGGYRVTYNNQPKVLLHKGNTNFEGTWLIENGYDSQNAKTTDDLPDILFDLSNAELGKYDVIVGTDTLKNAFEVKAGLEADVWAQVNGPAQFLLNRPTMFSIDYGNRSNVPAYNVPFFFCVPKKFGNVDVSLDFEVLNYSPYLDDKALEYAKQWNDYMPAVDENGDTICVYSFMIPYIGPNTTHQHTFHIVYHDNGQIVDNGNLRFYYVIENPWGIIENETSTARLQNRAMRRLASMDQMECMAGKFGKMLLEDGVISSIPLVGCAYTAGNTVIGGIGDVYTENGKFWKNFGKNFVSSILSCGSDLLGVGLIGKAAVTVTNVTWSFMNALWSRDECMGGDEQTTDTQGFYSIDPNEMIGPSGYDDQKHFIKPIHNMSYMVTYENKAEATAPANEVFIRDTLDVSKYDLATFGFTGYGWNNQSYNVGGSKTKEFTRDISYKVNGNDIIVRVSGQFDEKTGIAAWSFVSLDKNGKELQDIMQGFLPPNNADGIGEGFVTFSVEHKANPANGSSVSNKATIVFDYNKPIVTNTYVNTFDTDYPSSSITKVEEKDGKLVVTLSGSDATSGIGTYHIFAFKNGGEAELVATVTQGNQATFTCEPGTKYGLCVIATDNVGWNEPKDIKAEIEVTTSGTGINNVLIDNPSANDFIDLQGRRVKAPNAPGIYIQSKKKVVVK